MAQIRIRSILPNQSVTAGGGTTRAVCEGAGTVTGTVTVGGTSATVTTWADTYVDFTYPVKAAGTYDVVITNDDPLSDTYTSAVSYADAGTPIKTSAETQMKALIDAMSTATGYHFNWGAPDEPDESLEADMAVHIEDADPSEENRDDPDGAHSYSYTNDARYKIVVRPTLAAEEAKPVWAIRALWNKAEDDLKKRFGVGSGSTLNSTIEHFAYERSDRFVEASGDRFKPGRLETYWVMHYAQDRENPSVNG